MQWQKVTRRETGAHWLLSRDTSEDSPSNHWTIESLLGVAAGLVRRCPPGALDGQLAARAGLTLWQRHRDIRYAQ